MGGVLYVPLDSPGAWRLKLAKELKHAQIDVDMVRRRVLDEGLLPERACYELLRCYRRSELARALTVLKTRAQEHRPVVHRYEITSQGFVLGDVLTVQR